MFAQVVELQNKLSEESKKADKMEFEYKRVKEKVDSLQKEKDVGICVSQPGWLLRSDQPLPPASASVIP